MSADPLDVLRAEIDAIDADIHKLILRRAEVVADVAAAKRAAGGDNAPSAIRPGREAAILRTVLARHEGAVPPAAIARIWRELIATMIQLQEPMRIAVGAPTKSIGYWDLARDFFGSITPMTLYTSPLEAMRRIRMQPGTLAVLPAPNWRDSDPWWPALAGPEGDRLRVVARLPFVVNSVGTFERLAAVVLADDRIEDVAAEVTLIALRAATRQAPAAMLDWLKTAGFTGHLISVARADRRTDGAPWLHLVEVNGDIAADDPRLGALCAASGETLMDARLLGGYFLRSLDAETTTP